MINNFEKKFTRLTSLFDIRKFLNHEFVDILFEASKALSFVVAVPIIYTYTKNIRIKIRKEVARHKATQ